jgi:hypothetical protein
MNTARTLASYKNARKGYQSCMCPMCNGTESLKRHAKREWNRAIRRSESAQIKDEIQALYSDFEGDVTFRTYLIGLTLDNARNLRSVDWDY